MYFRLLEQLWPDKDRNEILAEHHMFWSGFAVGFTLQSHGFPLTVSAQCELEGEEHWFHAGRWAGRAVLIVSIVGIILVSFTR